MRVLSSSQWSMLQNVANRKVVAGPAGKTMGWLAYASSAPDYWVPFSDRDYADFLVLRSAELVTEQGQLTANGTGWVSPK